MNFLISEQIRKIQVFTFYILLKPTNLDTGVNIFRGVWVGHKGDVKLIEASPGCGEKAGVSVIPIADVGDNVASDDCAARSH
jgi:hypothetical protein